MPLLTELDLFWIGILQRCRPRWGWKPAAFGLIKGLDGSKVEDVNKQFRSATFRYSIITLVTLAWSCLAFSGEIHEATASGDLERVKALLKASPNSLLKYSAG